jgi:hypothetical protein
MVYQSAALSANCLPQAPRQSEHRAGFAADRTGAEIVFEQTVRKLYLSIILHSLTKPYSCKIAYFHDFFE